MRTGVNMPTVQAQTVNRLPRARQFAKRAINLSLSADVLDAAKSLQINVSQVCDSHLRDVVRREQEVRWRREHADFIAAYNASINAEGLPLDEWRTF
jgi:antitoxin CcdA